MAQQLTSALTGGPSVFDNAQYAATATHTAVIGPRGLYLRRQIVDCIHIRKQLKRWMSGRDLRYISLGNIPESAFDSIWAYCKHCYKHECCRQFLQYENQHIENIQNGGHTGWQHLNLDKRYRTYYQVDSMEHYWNP